ncbi:snakin-2-like [Arachis hypogaea]|uniref:snakin-2-like n=1 Tax=Arachis hypogaea TaxID=3818 RepID=UPI000DECC5FA|nr:snakin-2-like [Arachis hypogaea]
MQIFTADLRIRFDPWTPLSIWNEETLLSHRCSGACAARCRLSSRLNLCRRAYGTCCQCCNCVPPGTAGNQVCPCYASLTTHGGKRKCP